MDGIIFPAKGLHRPTDLESFSKVWLNNWDALCWGTEQFSRDGGFTLRADRTGGARDLLAVLRLSAPPSVLCPKTK